MENQNEIDQREEIGTSTVAANQNDNDENDENETVIEQKQQVTTSTIPSTFDNNNSKNQVEEEDEDKRPVALFVLFQHGSHGRPGALSYLKERMMKQFVLKCPRIKAVKFFDTNVNARLSSDDGTVICGERLVKEMVPEMEKFANEHAPATTSPSSSNQQQQQKTRLVFDMIGLSYGGILIREATFRLQTFHRTLANRFEFDMFCSIASPHTGVTELPNWKKGLGKFIGWCFSKTYDELLLTDKLLAEYMIDEAHINSLKSWKTRLLVANVSADKLVAFGTSSLMMEEDERNKQLEETGMISSTVTGVMNLTAPMNPVADTNTDDADLLARAVSKEDKNNNNTTSSPTTLAESADKKESEKDEHQIALKIARRLRQELDWQVVAVKPDSYFETAHHAVVGSSWISKPLDDAMDQIGKRLVARFGGVEQKEVTTKTSTDANVAMPAMA